MTRYTTDQLRDYDRADVDAMLDWAADEIDRLAAKNDQATDALQCLYDWHRDHDTRGAAQYADAVRAALRRRRRCPQVRHGESVQTRLENTQDDDHEPDDRERGGKYDDEDPGGCADDLAGEFPMYRLDRTADDARDRNPDRAAEHTSRFFVLLGVHAVISERHTWARYAFAAGSVRPHIEHGADWFRRQ